MEHQRRGSGVSDKHIRLAVENGWFVEAVPSSGGKISGYICGLDDYHFAVVHQESPVRVSLLSKSSTVLTIVRDVLLDKEPRDKRNQILEKVEPFRRSIQRSNTADTHR